MLHFHLFTIHFCWVQFSAIITIDAICEFGRLAGVAAALTHVLIVPFTFTPQRGYTGLHRAALNGHTDCLRLLMEAGANKDASDQVCVQHVTHCL